MNIEQMTLKNQLDTLLIDAPGSKSGTVQIWFRAGSALEKKGNEGIAHFLEHMFFKGTQKRPKALIAKEVESFGGEVNAFTSYDYTCYYVNTPEHNLENTVDIIMDMVANPLFEESELFPERGVVLEEFRRSIDNPNQFSFRELQKNCFPLGYAHPILGNDSTISNFSRDQVIFFRKQFYNLSNALLIVAGDLKTKKTNIIKTIENYYIPQGPKSNFPDFKLKKTSTYNLHKRDVRMASLTLAIQSPGYFATETSSEDLALNCLGHGETSRLYKELVHKDSLANHCSTSTLYLAKGGVHFLQVSAPTKNLKKLYQRLIFTLKQSLENELTSQEIQKIKNQYLSSKVYEKESLESFAFALGHGFAQTGDIHCEDQFINNIRQTSEQSVNEGLRNIFTKNIHFNLQIPKSEDLKLHEKDLQKLQIELENIRKNIQGKKTTKKRTKLSKFDSVAQVVQIRPGIKLIHRINSMTPTFVLHAYIKGGLREETASNNGIHHLLSNTLIKGHNNIPYENIKTILENSSSSIYGISGKNAYGISMHGLTEHMGVLSQHFFGAILAPDFATKYVKHEKEMVLRALENNQEDPIKQCFKTFNSHIFSNHPYSKEIIGTKTSTQKINSLQLSRMHRKNLNNKELLFTYCGDLSLDHVLKLITPYIDKLKARTTLKGNFKKIIPKYGKSTVIPFKREQTHILIGLPSFKISDPNDTFIKILNAHLSGQSSDLFVEVRDQQGLCYVVQPIHFSALEGGYWGIYIACSNEKTEQAISAVKKILSKIQKDGLSETEFHRVKKMLEGQSLINVQTNDDYANIYSIPELYNLGLDYYYESIQNIQKTEVKNFNKFMKKFLSHQWNMVVVGKEISIKLD